MHSHIFIVTNKLWYFVLFPDRYFRTTIFNKNYTSVFLKIRDRRQILVHSCLKLEMCRCENLYDIHISYSATKDIFGFIFSLRWQKFISPFTNINIRWYDKNIIMTLLRQDGCRNTKYIWRFFANKHTNMTFQYC